MSVSYKDYYKLLGVERSASAEDIAKAFKKLARKYHPDLNQGDAKSEEKFKELNEAYEVLKDPEKRKLYDKLGHNWQHGQQFQGASGFEGFNFDGQQFNSGGFSDFFEVLFGQAGRGTKQGGFGPDPFSGFSRRQRRGRDVEAEISISLEDALKGGRRNINLGGNQGSKTLDVNIPAGVREGAKLRLSGQGDTAPGGVAGDLFLRIKFLPHPIFGVDDMDITYDLFLSPWEAALGATVRVPTLDGEIEMNIPEGTSSGRRFRLRGRGLGSEKSRADQMVRVMIKTPENISDEERKLWQQLADISTFNAR